MARRNDIIEALVDHLGTNTDVHANNVSRSYKYLDDVNDFPYITFVPRQENRDHYGDGRKLAVLAVDLRVYVYDGDSSDIADECERLADQVEAAIDTFAETYRLYGVEESRVTTLTTDDGLMTPYGIADLQLSILYDVDVQYETPNIPLTVDITDITVDNNFYTGDATRR